jgi:hypothetical protein
MHVASAYFSNENETRIDNFERISFQKTYPEIAGFKSSFLAVIIKISFPIAR